MSDMDRPRGTVARARLLDCARNGGDIGEGALWIAAEECEDVDPQPWLDVLDELADELTSRGGLGMCEAPPAASIPVLAALLADRVRLHGVDGGHPRAHYLHTVLARGAGVPIACSAIWMAVGRRAGVDIEGVGLPGHFIVRVGSTLVDAFAGGEVLDESGVLRILTRAFGGQQPETIPAPWLESSTVSEMLARMSRNLRACHVARGDWRRALLAADRCVDLLPNAPSELRERGVLLARVGAHVHALEDLSAYLGAAAEPPEREFIEKLVSRSRSMAN